jgi:tetratricopeptide (TPR) repeat protein
MRSVARRVNDGNFIGAALAAQELLQLDLTPRQRLTMELRWVMARVLLMGTPVASITPDLIRLTERYPDHPAAFKMLAENYQSSNQLTAPTLALRYATRAAELDPADAEVHTDLAIALLLVGRRDEARSRAAELDRLDP